MKLAVSTYSLTRWQGEQKKSLAQMIDWIVASGASAVEFAGSQSGQSKNPLRRATALRKRCEGLGLGIAGYCVGAELLVAPAAQRKVIVQLKREVDVAATLGCKSMRHDVTRGFNAYKRYRGARSFAASLKILVPAIREVADYARDQGIITTFENHGFYMQQATRCERLLQAVNHPSFAITMDMGNFLCVNDDPVQAVARLARYAVMVHAKDFHVRPKKSMPPSGWFATPTPIALRGAIVGHGVIDVPRQLRLLKRAGYRGYLSLEFEGMEEPAMAVQLGLDYLREHLKAINVLD